MLEKIKDKIISRLSILFENEIFNKYPDVGNYFLSQIGVGIFFIFLAVIMLLLTKDWKIPLVLLAVMGYVAIRPISYYHQVKNNKIMIYEGVVTGLYDNSNEKGLKGNISRSYKRKFLNVACNGLTFTIYMSDIRNIGVGDSIRLYCNPENAIEKSENYYIINDYLVCIRLQGAQSQ